MLSYANQLAVTSYVTGTDNLNMNVGNFSGIIHSVWVGLNTENNK